MDSVVSQEVLRREVKARGAEVTRARHVGVHEDGESPRRERERDMETASISPKNSVASITRYQSGDVGLPSPTTGRVASLRETSEGGTQPVRRHGSRAGIDEVIRMRRASSALGRGSLSRIKTVSTGVDSETDGAPSFFCTDCGVLCCLDDLILDGPHKTHEYIYAAEQAVMTAEEIANLATPAQKARHQFDSRVAQLRRRISEVEQLCEKQAQSIDARFAALSRRIERRRDALQRELTQTRDRKLAPLRELLHRMTTLSDRADTALSQLADARRELGGLPPGPASPAFMARQQQHRDDDDDDRADNTEADSGGAESPTSPVPPAPLTEVDSMYDMRRLVGGVRSPGSGIDPFDESGDIGGTPSVQQSRKQVLARRREKEKQREDRKRRGRRQPPVPLSPGLLTFIRLRPQLVQALNALQTCAFAVPDADIIDVVFNARLETELDAFGRVSVSQAGFRPSSRANFGGTTLKPGAEGQGVVWWLGSKGGSEPFRNPAELGLLQVTSTALFTKGNKRVLASREPRDCFTGSIHGTSVTLFLGRQRRLVPSHYSITHGSGKDQMGLRTWILEGAVCDGSNDAPGMWHTVMAHAGEPALGSEALNLVTWEIAPVCYKAYQYFRIRMTGANSATDPRQQWALCLAGVELFGVLYEDS